MRRAAPIALLFVVALPRVEPATLEVDDDGTAPFATVQSAIDAAVPGEDSVWVRCGRYFENVTMRDGVSVRGEHAACTFIDPVDLEAPAVSMTGLGAGTELRGFTIENRPSLSPGNLGIAVTGGAPTITQNVIRGAGADLSYSGPGIYVSGGAPVISYNVIRDNSHCCFGGGVTLASDSGAVVRSNLIFGNAAYYGGGIYAGLASDGEVVHNTIARNAGWVGGGLLVAGAGTVANNAIVFNSAVIYGAGVADWSAGAVLENNNVFGNAPDDYSGSDPTGTNGNLSEPPGFLDEDASGFAGFQPRSSSPLIDAGSPAYTRARDLRGIPCPVDGDASGSAHPDIGARENEGVTDLRFDGVGLVWDPGRHLPHEFNVYRGDLAALRETGVYTQDPLAVEGARHFCGSSNSLADAELPLPGRAFFYLAAAAGAVEGTLGFDGDLAERPRELSCRP